MTIYVGLGTQNMNYADGASRAQRESSLSPAPLCLLAAAFYSRHDPCSTFKMIAEKKKSRVHRQTFYPCKALQTH